MTPFEIDILLWYHCRAEDHPHTRNPPPIWSITRENLISDGLLERTDGDMTLRPTERLHVYCEALSRVPLPVQVWRIPEAE